MNEKRDCAQLAPELTAWAAGETDEDGVVGVHLAECAACRSEAEELRALLGGMTAEERAARASYAAGAAGAAGARGERFWSELAGHVGAGIDAGTAARKVARKASTPI